MADSAPDQLSTLFRRVAKGKLDALEEVFEQWHQPLCNYAYALTRSDHAAEDAVADAMVGLLKAGRRLRRVQNPKAYLFGAVRHAAWRNGRAARKGVSAEEVLEATDERSTGRDPTEALAVKDALMALPEEQREVVVLKVHGRLTFAEIARLADISPNTAASRYRYAIEKLRRDLGDTDDES